MVRVLALALLMLAAGATQAHAQSVVISGADPEAYALDLRYADRGAGVLAGSERIDFVNHGPAPLERVWLRLWANGPDRCRPRRIEVEIDAPAAADEERARCTGLEVRLGAPVAVGASGSVALRFRVRGRRRADRFGRIGRTKLLGNVIPVLAVEDAGGLHLERYTDLGESFYSLSARWDATLRLPARLRAATSGALRSESVSGTERTVSVHSDQARDFALAIGPLRRRTTDVAGVRIRVHFDPRVRGVRRSLRAARRAVRALSRRLGPYGAGELDVVLFREDLGAGLLAGMEYPELVFSLPIEDVVTHEVAHQWWYGLVGNNQFAEPWLDESFAQYSHERLHPRTNFCRPGRPYELVGRRWRRIPLDSNMGLFGHRAPAAVGDVIYLAGSCALQTLERGIGRRRMTSVLSLLQSRNRFGVITKADVLSAIREVAPGFDLERWLEVSHLSA
jgi:Peptidase family M1 domain